LIKQVEERGELCMKILDMKNKEENTFKTLDLSIQKAIELDTDIVLATTSGKTVQKILEIKKQHPLFKNKIIVVTHAYGSRHKGENLLDETLKDQLRKQGIKFVTAAHVLSGAERGISIKHQGVSPVEIMADTLRMFSQGVKVCVEIAVMALDAGTISYGKPIISIGGNGGGANTSCLLTPDYAADILNTKIHEIYCKPY